MKKMIGLLFLFVILYFFYCLVATLVIMSDVVYREKNIIDGSFCKNIENGVEFKELEDGEGYNIKFNVKFCVSIFGLGKGKVFYIYTKEIYKNKGLYNGGWNVPVTLTVQRKGFFSWQIIKIDESP